MKKKKREKKRKLIQKIMINEWSKKLRDEWWQWVVYETEKEEMKLVLNGNRSWSR